MFGGSGEPEPAAGAAGWARQERAAAEGWEILGSISKAKPRDRLHAGLGLSVCNINEEILFLKGRG